MFGAGVDTAQGFLNGLKSQDSVLKKQYEKMADSLLATIKKKLGIKSPSREMAKLAGFTSQGWNGNLHLDPVTPGIDVGQVSSTAGGGSGFSDGAEVWLMADGEPIRVIVQRVNAGEAQRRVSSRMGGKR